MAVVCSVCTHVEAPSINHALSTGSVPVLRLASTFTLSRDALNYHRRAHLNSRSDHAADSQPISQPVPPVIRPYRGGRSRSDLRHGKTTERARERFLQAFAASGNVSQAAKRAGVGRASVYVWEEHDPEFAVAFREAGIKATEALEHEAWRRAKDGIAEPVFQHGKMVGTIQRYSDQLLMFLLKARAPERYRDRVDVSVTPVIKAVAGFDPAALV